MPRPPTVQVRSVVKILDAAAAAGVAPQALCRAVGLDSKLIADPDNRIPFAQLVALYEHAAQLTGDDAFGLHVGERTSPTLFDVLGYVVINSPTLGAALDRLVRYHAIWTDGASFELTEQGAHIRLSYNYVPPHRAATCANARWPSAKLPICSASPAPAPSTAPSVAGQAARLKSSARRRHEQSANSLLILIV
jgi:hypothetical protein